jgi:hypothetical protein
MLNKLSPRERMLAIIVGALVVVFALFFVASYFYNTYNTQNALLLSLDAEKKEMELNKDRAKLASERRHKYELFSLGSDPEEAKTAYNSWLTKAIQEYGLKAGPITKVGPTERKYNEKTLGYESRFSVKATGDLKQLTKFLHHFHTSQILHRITSLSIQPEDGAEKDKAANKNQLVLNFSIELLSLPGSKAKEEIGVDESLLTRASLEEYTSVILPRNMFGLPNNPPRFLTKDKQQEEIGKRVSIDLRASDPDDDKVTFELLETSVKDAKIEGDRLTIPVQEKLGQLSFKVRASDDHPDTKYADLDLTLAIVDPPPPPKKVEKVVPPPFDPSVRTRISSIVGVEGELHVWINIKPTGERLDLVKGDEFKVGPHKGLVIDVFPGAALLEIDGDLGYFKAGDEFLNPRAVPTGLVD